MFSPLALIGVHQGLVRQPVHLGGHARHVQRKVEQQRQRVGAQKPQLARQRLGQVPGPAAGDDKAPLAKAGHMRVVGRGAQAHRFDGLHHRPEALARHQRRSGLHHGVAAGCKALLQQGIKAVGVELADGEIGGVGEIDHDHVKCIYFKYETI